MTTHLCHGCGRQYTGSALPPERCEVCSERQCAERSGQQWTTIEKLAEAHIERIEPGGDLLGIGFSPNVAIPHRKSPATSSVVNPGRAAQWAFGWAVLFTVAHVYWYLGGRLGLGDAPDPLPGMPDTALGWIFNGIVALMFFTGMALPLAMLRRDGTRLPRRLLMLLLWVGCVVLVLRGGSGLLDDLIRNLGISEGGITGLNYQQILGEAHPSTYTLWSGVIINAYFLVGGLLFGALARIASQTQPIRRVPFAPLSAETFAAGESSSAASSF